MRTILTRILIAITTITLIASCARPVRQTVDIVRSDSMNVFSEAKDGMAETGKVDVVVSLSLKTHLPGFYILESGKSLHGKPGYPLVFTVDGQTIVWQQEGSVEKTPAYDTDGLRTPEGGKGRRYVFQKRVRLNPGSHRVEVDLPEDDYACAFRVALNQRSEPYLLELRPAYYTKPGKQRASFLNGVKAIDAYLDTTLVPLERS